MTYFTTTFSSRSLSAVYMLFLQLHANTVINKHYLKTALLHTTSTNPSADHVHREGFVLVLESWLGSWLVFQLVLSRPANIDKLWSGSYPLPSPSLLLTHFSPFPIPSPPYPPLAPSLTQIQLGDQGSTVSPPLGPVRARPPNVFWCNEGQFWVDRQPVNDGLTAVQNR